jgi:hypothetical protein
MAARRRITIGAPSGPAGEIHRVVRGPARAPGIREPITDAYAISLTPGVATDDDTGRAIAMAKGTPMDRRHATLAVV